jgi:outer membrane protease
MEISDLASADTAYHQTLVTTSAIPNAASEVDFYEKYTMGVATIRGNYHGHEFELNGTINVSNLLLRTALIVLANNK